MGEPQSLCGNPYRKLIWKKSIQMYEMNESSYSSLSSLFIIFNKTRSLFLLKVKRKYNTWMDTRYLNNKQ